MRRFVTRKRWPKLPRLAGARLAGALLLAAWSLASVAHASAPIPDSATSAGAPEGDQNRVEATLLFDAAQVAPGDTFRVGVHFRMDPDWHIYWRHAGESGLATEVEFAAIQATFSPLRWPFPVTFRTADGYIVTYGYDGEVLLFAVAQVAEGATGALEVAATADVLVCKIDCIPALLELRRSLPVGDATVPGDDAPRFDAAAARVPRGAGSLTVAATVSGDRGRALQGTLRGLPAGWRPAPEDAFAPDLSPGFEALRWVADERAVRVEGRLAVEAEEPPRVRGVAHLVDPEGASHFVEVDAPVEAADAAGAGATVGAEAAAAAGAGAATGASAPTAGAAGPSLLWILLLALCGGALLNLMPCVFPVLAVKVYGLARIAQEGRRSVGIHALAYAGGVVGSLLALGLAVVAARAAGVGVGWGFQFQEPLFVALVCAVVVAFALNLFGVFQVGLAAGGLVERVEARRDYGRSVGEGVLAVVLATPCSAPILGTAVGFAFAAPAGLTLLVFAVLGVGLAAPFCLLVVVPGLAERLPRPGPWMDRLKHGLGFALLATAAWLVWVMGGLRGVDAMARLLGFLIALSFALWIFGLTQYGGRRHLGALSAGALLACAGWVSLAPLQAATPADEAPAAQAGSWSEEAVAAALAAGRPVFVDFTADWCLTCKFNERTVLAARPVREAFARHDVEFLVGDWTRRDEAIRQKLAAHGKAGVPLYLVYAPDRPDEPEVLPELLTEQLVIDSLARATARP